MRNFLVVPVTLLCGCMTNLPDGTKKHNLTSWINPMNWGSSADSMEKASSKLIVVDQLAPLIYVAIPLIIAGAAWWWTTKGHTGLGKLSVGLGLLFIGIAVVLPQIIVWLKFIVLAVLIGAIAFAVWDLVQKKRGG